MIKFTGKGHVARARRVADLQIGEHGWTTPWSVRYNRDNEPVSVSLSQTLEREPGGTVVVKVTRTGPAEYEIDVTRKYFGGIYSI